MKLGITSWTCRWAVRSGLDAQGVLEYAAGLGLGVVQFCENLPLWDLSASEVDDLLAASGELGVAVQLGTKGLDSELLRQCLDLTERLGSRVLRLALGASDADEAEKALRGVLPDCDEHGITLALENQFDLPSAELALVIKALNDPLVAACLDSANSVAFLEKPLDTADTLAQFAVQLHVKDYVVSKYYTGYHITGCPMGEGLMDVPGLLAKLEEAGQRPDVFVEQWMDAADTDEATLKKEREWIERGVERVREFLRDRAWIAA